VTSNTRARRPRTQWVCARLFAQETLTCAQGLGKSFFLLR